MSRRNAPLLFAVVMVVGACGSDDRPLGADSHSGANAPHLEYRRTTEAVVELPLRATASVRVSAPSASRVALAFALEGAHDVPGEQDGDRVVYRGATPSGGDWIHRAVLGGTEDDIQLPVPPVRSEVRYRVDVSRVAGLRLVADVLEFVDDAGAPRLRMRAPSLTSASGRRFRPALSVDGCAFDSDPRAPWNRPVLPPGSASCSVVVSWRAFQGEVSYPAVVDPVWDVTTAMSVARSDLTATVLSGDRVLAVGGMDTFGLELSAAEIYDASTKTWAATQPLKVPRFDHVAVTLLGSDALVMGGSDSSGLPLSSVERYSPTAGAWTSAPSMVSARVGHTANVLSDGRVLVAGGSGDAGPTAEILDAALTKWSPLTMPSSRSGHSATMLGNGTVLLAGGVDETIPAVVSTAVLFDPSDATTPWKAVKDMPSARASHTATILPDGRVVLIGGESWFAKLNDRIAAFDPTIADWNPQGSIAHQRAGHSADLLPSGKILVAGGTDFTTTLQAAELVSGTLNGQATLSMNAARERHASARLGDGRVIVIGGYRQSAATALATAEIYSRSLGNPCVAGDDCASGFCSDGVCCDRACIERCEACIALQKGSGSDGTCGPVAQGTDPTNDCAAEDPTSCGATGTCDGKGECTFYPAGQACSPPTCIGSTLTSYACTGNGACSPSVVSCAPYLCGAGATCLTSCNSDAQCASSAYCAPDHTCVSDVGNGAACTSAAQCASGFCVDGVCCDSRCDGICQACSGATNTSGIDGKCGTAHAGSNPHGDCKDEGAVSCGDDGACDGNGACQKYAAGTPCGTTTCDGNGVQLGPSCNGQGSCIANQPVACAPKLCVNGACADCDVTGACATTAFCQAGQCVTKYENGAPCTSFDQCKTGVCADGYCCNKTCDGQCEACDVADAHGICVPLADPETPEKHGRPACDQGTADNPCSARTCDGGDTRVQRDSCNGYVGTTVSCRSGSCTEGVATLGASCDGKGTCPTATQLMCEPYACGADGCLTACASDTDCIAGTHCDAATHQCRALSTCDGAHTTMTPDGKSIDCSPYVCDPAGFCKVSCMTSADCVVPDACNASHHCAPPPSAASPAADGGCACEVGATSGGTRGAKLALLLFLGAIVAGRRRRSTRGRAVLPLVASLVAACSSAGHETASHGEAQSSAVPLPDDARAARRIEAVRETFRIAPGPALVDQHEPTSLPVLAGGLVQAFEPVGDGVHVAAHLPRVKGVRHVDVELPRRASDSVRLASRSRATLEIALAGASDQASLEVANGIALYEAALGEGFDLIRRVDGAGVEDLVVLPTAERSRVRYEIDVANLAGLRLVSNVLELMDARGAPSWRLATPYVVDARGVRHEAPIAIEDCAADTDPALPWGRAVVPPGGARCHVVVTWPVGRIAYPALLDPSWQYTADSMNAARKQHVAARLPDGRVVVAGGIQNNAALKSAEVYDPVTDTWAAAVPSMATARTWATASPLPNGRILVVGGQQTSPYQTLDSAEQYDPAIGWTTSASKMSTPRFLHTATQLSTGDIVVTGGSRVASSGGNETVGTAEVFLAATATWQTPIAMSQSRVRHGAALLSNDRVLVTGGLTGSTATGYQTLQTTEIFDGSKSPPFSLGPPMNAARQDHAAVTLADGRVFVGGGDVQTSGPIASVEVYDGTWHLAAPLPAGRSFMTATVLNTGKVLFAGGYASPTTNTVLLFDPTNLGSWSSLASMNEARQDATATLLASGDVLIAGGSGGSEETRTAERYRMSGLGGVCDVGDDCGSGYCVDGVCCDAKCDGTCMACTAAKKGSGSDGHCGLVAANTDPDLECAASPPCGQTGLCDGNGACATTPVGTACGPVACTSGILTGSWCTAQHQCQAAPQSCSPYVCATAASCGTACVSNADCDAAAYCDFGVCKLKQPDGGTCTSGEQCVNPFCVEGVCCNTSCSGTCQSCRAATSSSGVDGTCGAAKAGTDPQNSCTDDGASTCGHDGLCDGAGQCSYYAIGTPCGPTVCDANAVSGSTCTGPGACGSQTVVPCGLYLCDQGACPTTCGSDADCVVDAFCESATCKPRLKLGYDCVTSDSCTSGLCVDGVCCNAPCDRQCEACDVEGAKGTCAPVVGVPHLGRPACSVSAADPCQQGTTCDGVTRQSCEGFAGADTTCREASCVNGYATAKAVCDGHGNCPAAIGAPCIAYACGPDACKTSCLDSGDCAPGASCSSDGRCIIGDICDGDHTITKTDGTSIDCSPYKCQADATCAKACTSPTDCVAPAACTENRTCVAPSGGDQGCSCRVVGSANGDDEAPPVATLALALGALATAGGRRGRRRWRRSSGRPS